MRITREMIISEVVSRHPETAEIFSRYGMGCLRCMGVSEETVEAGARRHEIDVEQLIEALNKALGRERNARSERGAAAGGVGGHRGV